MSGLAVDFQEAILISVAPLIYDGLLILLGLSVVVACIMPLLTIAKLFRLASKQ